MQPYGAEQEVLTGLRTQSGEVWGCLGLYREPGQPQFDADELEFLREVSTHLADGARRGLLIGEATDPEGLEAPGLVVLCFRVGQSCRPALAGINAVHGRRPPMMPASAGLRL